jgi:hypothetical protein
MIDDVTAMMRDMAREIQRAVATLDDLQRVRRGEQPETDEDPLPPVATPDAARDRRKAGAIAAQRRAAELHDRAAQLQEDAGRPDLAERERARAAARRAAYAEAIEPPLAGAHEAGTKREGTAAGPSPRRARKDAGG